MGQTYLNQITTQEVAIAVEQVLIAPFPTTWTPAKIADPVDNPPAGFRNLGAVVEDSVTLTITREKYQLKTGIPKNLQYEAVIGLTGMLEATLIARRGRFAGYALGNVLPVNMIVTTPATGISSVTNRGTITTSAAQVWVVGDLIVADTTTPGLITSEADAYVSSINGTTVVFSPAFPNTLTTSNFLVKATGQRNPFGTSKIRQFHVLGVADFIDGVQVVHDFQKCDATGDWTEQFRPDQEGRMNIKFEGLGYTANTYDSSATHLLVGERFWFNV